MTGSNQKKIIEWLDSRDDSEEWFTLEQITEGVRMKKSTVKTSLSGLVAHQYVVRKRDERGFIYNRLMYVAKKN